MEILQKAKQEALDYLFDGYLKNGGTPIFDVTPIAGANEIEPQRLGKFLADNGWIKNYRYDGRTFSAAITMQGILQVKPQWIEEMADKVIYYLGSNNNEKTGLQEILDLPPKDFQITFDLAKLFEQSGYIECKATATEIFVWLTPRGIDYYNDNRPQFGI